MNWRTTFRITLQEGSKRRGTVSVGWGWYTKTLYAWYDPDTETYLSHGEIDEGFAQPFFENEEGARQFLDHRSREVDDKSCFEGLPLQKLRAKKIGEVVEVLTDQSGIEDFVPDGGTHKITDLEQDKIWL